MDRSLKWRTISLFGIILLCVGVLLPSLYRDEGDLPRYYPFKRKINLGLDLEGGLHIVYSIDLNTAITDRASEIERSIRTQLTEEQKPTDPPAPLVRAPLTPLGAVTVLTADPAKKAEVEARIKSDWGDSIENRDCDAADGPHAVCIKVSQNYAENLKKSALENAVNTIRERIDEKGVAEPSVVQKDEQIIVELPGLDEEQIAETRDLIARTAKLEFKIVDDGSTPGKDGQPGRPGRGAPFMQNMLVHVGSLNKAQAAAQDAEEDDPVDPLAKQMGVYVKLESWPVEDSRDVHQDIYLMARDRTEELTLDQARATGCVMKRDRNLATLEKTADGRIKCPFKGWQVIDRYLKQTIAANPNKPELQIPENRELGYEYVEPDQGKDRRPFWRSYFLVRAVELTGTSISDAAGSFEPNTGKPIVLLDFNRSGGKIFGDLTARIVGQKLATILDGKVKSAPIINGAIRGGRASITMGGTDANTQIRERDDLVNVLKTGSLPAPLREESVSTVGPTLGRDAIDKAKLSFILGVILVVLLMVGIYRWSGWIAVGAVIFHNLLTLAVMAVFGATLTLPGVAAIVLSVGMTVDGNILIYERIRDELLLGKSVRGAVDLGFTRAFSAILDGQLTTATAGWVLLQYGSGPIKGFATLLLVGVFTTITTNTWVTRIFFDWYIAKKKGQMATISI